MKQKKAFCYTMLAVSILFYLFWFLNDGVYISKDAKSYIEFSMSREPVYPTLLATFRLLFGENYYFNAVGVFQSVLLGYAVWKLSDTLFATLKLDKISFVILQGVGFAVSLLTRFAANRHTMYSLSISSEGIAIPLFLLFVIQIFQYAIHIKQSNLIGTVLMGILLISTRKQMYIVIPIMGCVFFVLWLLKKYRFSKLLLLWGVTILTFFASTGVDRCYNYIVRGEFIRHSTDTSAMLITTIFTAEKSDAMQIENEEIRELFFKILDERDTQGLGYADAKPGWKQMAGHYADSFDLIAFGIVNPTFVEYLNSKGITEYVEVEIAFGKINDYMLSCILKSNVGKIAHVFGANALQGFCNTIAKDSAILFPFIILAYVIYIVELIYLFCKHKMTPEVIFGIVCFFCILINVSVVSLMIFSQSRYMIYNMPLFYCAGYVMLRRILLERKEN